MGPLVELGDKEVEEEDLRVLGQGQTRLCNRNPCPRLLKEVKWTLLKQLTASLDQK